MTTLSVVIPAYNEESGIEDIVERVLDVQDGLGKIDVAELELIVVDDGSADRTAAIMGDISAKNDNVVLISHDKNQGYGAALKTGFNSAKGELIGFLDADGTYPPEYFPALCEPALQGADLVVGSRMAGEDSQMPITRRIGNFFFATLLSILGRKKVTDSASGMRVFKKELLERIYPLPDGLNLTPVMSTRAVHEKVNYVEVPIPYSERVGRSKLSVVRDGSVFLQSMVWTALTYNPVRIFGGIGIALLVLSAIILIGILISRIMGVTTLSSLGVFALFSAFVFGFAGFSIFALGITFNYLVSLFYHEPISQGLLGGSNSLWRLDKHFWWMGGAALITGLILGIISLILGTQGWDITRLWFYLLGSAMLILTGLQLIIYWLQVQVLDELSQRDMRIMQDSQT